MATLARLRDAIGGQVIEPGDDGYDDARRVWNGMIDRRPPAIVRAATSATSLPTIRAARELGLPLAIRGGGHNVAGNGTVDGGIVLDLGADGRQRRSGRRAGPGRGRARPSAMSIGRPSRTVWRSRSVSSRATGVAGLTLGGGVGWLTRAYGLTVDNLLRPRSSRRTGERVHASATENADLFWGLRGGGGNFGVVTVVHVPGPSRSGRTCSPAPSSTGETSGPMRCAAGRPGPADLPDAMTSIATFLVPPPEFELGDDPIMLIGFVWASPDRAEGERVVDRLRAAAPPDEEVVATDDLDGVAVRGRRRCSRRASGRTGRTRRLTDSTTRRSTIIVDRRSEQTWRGTAFDIHHMGGAFGRVPEDATPFPNRSARYWLNVYGFWTDAADDAAGSPSCGASPPTWSRTRPAGAMSTSSGRGRPRGPASAALAVYGPDKLRPPRRRQAPIRPGQPVPPQPQHPTGLIDGQSHGARPESPTGGRLAT